MSAQMNDPMTEEDLWRAINGVQGASARLSVVMDKVAQEVEPFCGAHYRFLNVFQRVPLELRSLREENARLKQENDLLRTERDGATIDELIPQVGEQLRGLRLEWKRENDPPWGTWMAWWMFVGTQKGDAIGRPRPVHFGSGVPGETTLAGIIAMAKKRLKQEIARLAGEPK